MLWVGKGIADILIRDRIVGIGGVGYSRVCTTRIAPVAHVRHRIGMDQGAACKKFACPDGLAFQPSGMSIKEGAVQSLRMSVACDIHSMVGGIVVKVSVEGFDPAVVNGGWIGAGGPVPLVHKNNGLRGKLHLVQSQR